MMLGFPKAPSIDNKGLPYGCPVAALRLSHPCHTNLNCGGGELIIMEVCFDRIVQTGVFMGSAGRHAVLPHIGIAAAGSDRELCTLHGCLWKCLSFVQVVHICSLPTTPFSLQLCQLVAGRLCYLILV